MKTNKKQIKDLTLFEVDYLVAKAEDLKPITDRVYPVMIEYNTSHSKGWEQYSPTTNPAQGWPIIERDRIKLLFDNDGNEWEALLPKYDDESFFETGKTSLEAAMRCKVASVYGDEVSL